jgi:acetyl esterase/lipase
LTNAKQVTHDTPPCFLFHTAADPVVPVLNSVNFYLALLREGVPAELHVFEQGQQMSEIRMSRQVNRLGDSTRHVRGQREGTVRT